MKNSDVSDNEKVLPSNMSFSVGSQWLFISQVGVLICSLAISIITARWLGPYGKGVVAILMLVPGFVASFGNLGLTASNIYFISGRRRPLEEIAGTDVCCIVVVTAISLAVLATFWGPLEKTILKGLHRHFLYYVGPLILLQLMDSVIVSSWLLGLQRFKLFSIAKFMKYLLLLCLILLFVVALNLSITGVVISLLIADGIYIFYCFFVIFDHV